MMKVKVRFKEETISPDGVEVKEFEVPYEARQLTAENQTEMVEWCEGSLIGARHAWTAINVPVPDGSKVANLYDWIVKDPFGRFYPCTAEIFEKTFIPIGENDV